MVSSLPWGCDSLNDPNELWPNGLHQGEPDILYEVYNIADGEQEGITDEEGAQVAGHVPEMVWFHKFEETSSANIRRALGIDDAEQGSRVFYIIVFRKLCPITDLSGEEFLNAWWHAVGVLSLVPLYCSLPR
ncbi:hypothetical protein AZE42_08684 [Rhizopogon vesiculosus]|uniref:Uncharacterized protein n=1 Tax=Rhizopogon vesiculosus TaxID=180088 RepID=A0A1J8Q9H9_9AGAM|nr:hypothetical protein AZE42_08684 [Rhizopogon vesiculosus]